MATIRLAGELQRTTIDTLLECLGEQSAWKTRRTGATELELSGADWEISVYADTPGADYLMSGELEMSVEGARTMALAIGARLSSANAAWTIELMDDDDPDVDIQLSGDDAQ